MKRSDFIRLASLSTLGLPFLSLESCTHTKEIVQLTLLHTNDMHSRIDPFPADDPKFPNQGGMARRFSLIDEIRRQEKHVLLLDAGDVFQGTPYFNLFGGEIEFKLMSQMKYDACAIGNHDLDNGISGLAGMLHHANFPFLCANYDFSKTALSHRIKPWIIIEKGPIKIGIIGVGVELDGLVIKENYGNIVYHHPAETVNTLADELRQMHGVHLVIVLSHLGFEYESEKISDRKLAQQCRGVDVIIGGHTHTFMDKPATEKDLDGKNVLIHQVGWGGLRLGRIDISFHPGSHEKIACTQTYDLYPSVPPHQNPLV